MFLRTNFFLKKKTIYKIWKFPQTTGGNKPEEKAKETYKIGWVDTFSDQAQWWGPSKLGSPTWIPCQHSALSNNTLSDSFLMIIFLLSSLIIILARNHKRCPRTFLFHTRARAPARIHEDSAYKWSLHLHLIFCPDSKNDLNTSLNFREIRERESKWSSHNMGLFGISGHMKQKNKHRDSECKTKDEYTYIIQTGGKCHHFNSNKSFTTSKK